MSVKQELNVLSQMRIDVPHLRSINSSVIKDFGLLLESFSAQKPYILKGFNIPINTAIGQPATSMQVVVDDSIVWIPANIKGGFLNVPSGTSNEVLSTSNAKVSGSFIPNSTNYLAVRLVKATDPSTADLVAFYDVDSNVEFTKTVPTGLVLNYEFVITTSGFGDNTPIAKIITNAGNAVTSVENCKNGLFRLGAGGDNPDINYEFQFTTVPENSLTATNAGDPDPFAGGDWEIGTFKEWMDAVMTELKKIKGSAFWYTSGSSALDNVNLLDLYNDAVGSVATGRGKFRNTAGTLGWTSDVYIKSIIGPRIYTIPTNSVAMADGQVAYIQLVRNDDFQPSNTFNFTAASNLVYSSIPVLNLSVGDWIRAVSHEEADWRQIQSIAPSGLGSVITLTDTYPKNGANLKALKSESSYSVQVADPENVPSSADVYWIAKRDDLTFTATNIDSIERSSGVITVTLDAAIANLAVGQNISISGVTSELSFNGNFIIASIVSPTEFTITNTGPDVAPISGEGAVSAPAKIYLRWLGELSDGESAQFDDNIPAEVLQYIGSPNESASAPLYNDSPAGSLYLPNYNSIAGEDLTTRLSKVTAMLADNWQDNNLSFDPGLVVFDGANISISGASLSIPGTGVGSGPVIINAISNIAIADNEAIYIDISRSINGALTLSAPTDIELLTPSQQRLILYRRIGTTIQTRPSSVYRHDTGHIYEVDFVDPISVTLPSGAGVNIDGVAGSNGDRVLFTNLSSNNNRVYLLSGVGTSIVWTAIPMFDGGSVTPENGALIKSLLGLSYHNQLGKFDQTYWNFNDITRHFNAAGDYYEISSLRNATLSANTSGNIFTIPLTASDNLIIDYSLSRDVNREAGQLYVTHNNASATISGGSAVVGTLGISFSANIVGPDLVISYTADNSGPAAEMKYSLKRWSNLPGGPEGLPAYQAFNTLPTAVINTAYATSDGSNTEVNCLPPTVVSGKTQIELLFTYTVALLPGTTSGDLEVYIDGKFIPRYVPGVTVDAFYKEIDSNTLEFNRDYSLVPVSIEIRKKYGSYDVSTVNGQLLNKILDVTVGSSSDVLNGVAAYDSINDAIAAVATGGTITVFKSYIGVEDVLVNKELTLLGLGRRSEITGNLTISANYCLIKNLYVSGDITFSPGSNANILNESWQAQASTILDSGIDNAYTVIGI